MFSLFDLQDLCGNEEKLRTFLESYGVLRDPSCDCGGTFWVVSVKMGLLPIEDVRSVERSFTQNALQFWSRLHSL